MEAIQILAHEIIISIAKGNPGMRKTLWKSSRALQKCPTSRELMIS
jgi:hypothetical protein